MEKEKFTLNDVITEIENDTLKQIDKTDEEKYLTLEGKRRKSFFKFIIMNTIGKFLIPLKIRITFLWNEKEIFTYEIPKN